MNRINPHKLIRSKWTALMPENKERHFIVIEIILNENDKITGCILEAVINHNTYTIAWQELTNSKKWLMGW